MNTSFISNISTIGKNLNSRRGSTAKIRVPKAISNGSGEDDIEMDAMSFGMGCTCLQATMQAPNLGEARRLFDAMVPIAPFLMAITASTPIFRGILSDRDCRWDVIAASVDDRTREEKEQLNSRSRYSGISRYISMDQPSWASNLSLPFHRPTYDQLIAEGIDHQLSQFVATLFIRDPLVVYREFIHQNDDKSTDHWENIQSTNWQSVRFKPPPSISDDDEDEYPLEIASTNSRTISPSIGWRIEVRTMENQLDDFSNAAVAIFVILLARGILFCKEWSFYTPISLVDENLRKAQLNDACRCEKFYFPTNTREPNGSFRELTIDEIFNGPDGLVTVARRGLESIYADDKCNFNPRDRATIEDYISFVAARSAGKLLTPAQWIRTYVQDHPEYQKDGLVPPIICHDLVKTIDQIGKGQYWSESLLGPSQPTKH